MNIKFIQIYKDKDRSIATEYYPLTPHGQ